MATEKNLTLNRIVSFLAGGLLIFAIMSFTTVSSLKKQNSELSNALDTSRYEAGRLLTGAKAQFDKGDFTSAKLSLTNLFENQPGSTEAAEGRILFPEIEAAEVAVNMKWEAALPEIQAQWSSTMATDLRATSDAERVKLENEMEEKIDQAWEKAKSKVRTEWESQS